MTPANETATQTAPIRRIRLRLPRHWPRPVGDPVRPGAGRPRHASVVSEPATVTVRIRNGEQGGAPGAGGWAHGKGAAPPAQSPERASVDPDSLGRGPILVVDDDPSILGTVEDILAMEGYEVVTAGNGAQALRVIERARPALVLLDMRMPVLDGWGFAHALRERGIGVPVLVMTAAQDARRWAEEIEADGYLAKPFRLLDLLDAVERFVPPPES